MKKIDTIRRAESSGGIPRHHWQRQPIEKVEQPNLEPIDSSWSVAQHCRKEAV